MTLYQVVRHYVVRVPRRVIVLVILILQTITQVIQTMVSHEFITIIDTSGTDTIRTFMAWYRHFNKKWLG